ncbi:MAG: error-prone DNA polymerase, partial [Bacteroidetes bacterium]|nr:error-prone DNA polymerase [Bacteroidota bacterium]
VEVRPVDVNYSGWDNTLEERTGKYTPIRLGFRQIKGLKEEDLMAFIVARQEMFITINAIKDAGVSIGTLERLADADAFRSLGLDRRQALWQVAALGDTPNGIFTGQRSDNETEATIRLPAMTLPEHVVLDYAATSLSLKAHPVSFVREQLNQCHITAAKDLTQLKDGSYVKVAGLVLVRQRPGTASGIVFITLEDETGIANTVVFAKLFDTYRKEILRAKLLMVEGKLQKEGEVIHIIAKRCHDMTNLLKQLGPVAEDHSVQTLSRADETDYDNYQAKNNKRQKQIAVQAEIFPEGRNFK